MCVSDKTRLFAVCVLAAGLLAAPAHADKTAAPAAVVMNKLARLSPCQQQENVNLSVNFNIKTKSFANSKVEFDKKMDQIMEFAKQQKVGKFEMQSMNYNVSSQVSYDNGVPEPGYQLSGNASFMMDSADNAFKMGEFLTGQKIQVSVNVNKYRNGSCNGLSE